MHERQIIQRGRPGSKVEEMGEEKIEGETQMDGVVYGTNVWKV